MDQLAYLCLPFLRAAVKTRNQFRYRASRIPGGKLPNLSNAGNMVAFITPDDQAITVGDAFARSWLANPRVAAPIRARWLIPGSAIFPRAALHPVSYNAAERIVNFSQDVLREGKTMALMPTTHETRAADQASAETIAAAQDG